MPDTYQSYRIRTDVGDKLTTDYITVDANLVQDYDAFDILSVSIRSTDTYRLHNANYGVVVGRVIANNGFGVPNAKISVFIASDGEDGEKVRDLYPFSSSAGKDGNDVRYNLLPNEKVSDCHQVVGTFPNKRYALDNDVVLEVFDKYYKYTTRTNNSGDYLIMGVPTGNQTLHMDLDISDCGILSQRPRDFVYKGYTIEQFENPNMFKEGTDYQTLSQVFSQDQVVNVRPFWGNDSLGEELGITRADINVAFTFEPTCVFMGSVISDNSSQGITKKCMGTENMGNMEEMVTGEGTIEMIRYTPSGEIEEFQVKGTQLIDGNGVWCYQIPMNLDYMMTDEYGNMVPTDDPSKGIPTRTRVRFRISMADTEENVDNYFRPKVLVPHNPQNNREGGHEDYDYEFGTYTREDSYRDLFWNNVYSVKSYIPRFQKRKAMGWKDKRFVAIKNCNFFGSNNPIPYNNIRIRLPFMFTVMCAIIKTFIFVVGLLNTIIGYVGKLLTLLGTWKLINFGGNNYVFSGVYESALNLSLTVLMEGLCPDLENWYFAPMISRQLTSHTDTKGGYPGNRKYDLMGQTIENLMASEDATADVGRLTDPTSIDTQNAQESEDTVCLTTSVDYLLSCVEMNLAMEYRVINFDFYNDWLNGTIYFPRFMRYVKPKVTFLGIRFAKAKVKGCMDDTAIFSKTRRYTQQCAIGYTARNVGTRIVYTNVRNPITNEKTVKTANNIHKAGGFAQKSIFGSNGGICHEHTTLKGQYVYYMKPCEWTGTGTIPGDVKINLFATDIILLGSLNDCDMNGLPQAFKYLSSTSYVLPTNLALTNMEENGMLYATDEGTICRGATNQYAAGTNDGDDVPIKVVPQNDGLSGEIIYFSGAGATDIDLQYDGKELSDIIALTEAAGISWNFTGPGQGEPDDTRMFTPGGHFLGLSCTNAQTNIKSCINLSRICEVGANMSQRKEEVSSMDSEGNLHYTYTVPSGFISGNDIVGADFRSMFATMNHKRLIATKTNPETGYKMYDFTFVKPINFNGAFSNIATEDSPYNQKITLPDENATALRNAGIQPNGEGREDYDSEEEYNTQISTNESASIDYYMFRMGMDFDDLTRGSEYHLRKYLNSTDVGNLLPSSRFFMPQYENSYYFYFGLKVGSTAIEQFNSQFFSTCAKSELLTGVPGISVNIAGDVDLCTSKASVRVVTNNMTTPFQYIRYWKEGDNSMTNIDMTNDREGLLNRYAFTIDGLSYGTYNFTIMDANGNDVTQTIVIGSDLVRYNIETYDFNGLSSGSHNNESQIFRGGYLEYSNVMIPSLDKDMKIKLKLYNENGGAIGSQYETGWFDNDGSVSGTLKIDRANVNRVLYVVYDCGQGSGQQKIPLSTFSVKDGASIKLYMGIRGVFQWDLAADPHATMDWWDNITGSTEHNWIAIWATFNEINRDALGTETFSNNIVAEGATKAVWGTPQNSEGFYDGGTMGRRYDTYCNEDYEGIPGGYMLDDESSYYSTEWYENPNLGINGGAGPKHYSIQAYDGTAVYGDYYGILEDGGTPRFINGGREFFHKDYGYIFKPLPSGDLQFKIYDGNSLKYDNPDGEIMNGIFFPTYIIPVINRPFFAKARFFIWEHLTWDFDASPRYADAFEAHGRSEVTVYNGITYNNRFSNKSYIFNLSGKTLSTQNRNDLYGVSQKKDRELFFSGYTWNGSSTGGTGVSGETDISINIIEGSPTGEKYENYVKTINESVYSTLADNIQIRYNGSGTTTCSVVPVWRDTPNWNDENEYFLCRQNSGYELIGGDAKLINTGEGRKTHMVLSTLSGQPFTSYVFARDRNNMSTMTGPDGSVIVDITDIEWSQGRPYRVAAAGLSRLINAGCGFVLNQHIIQNNSKSWETIIEKSRLPKNPKIYVNTQGNDGNPFNTGDNRYYGVGKQVLLNPTSPNTDVVLYKIYPNPIFLDLKSTDGSN